MALQPARPGQAIIGDAALVAAARAGRREAFDELVRRYRGAVLLVAAQAAGCREIAQDVSQETFVVAYEKLRQLKDDERFAAWICMIARNTARRAGRKAANRVSADPERMDLLLAAHCPELVGNPVATLLKRERDSEIRNLMEGLPEGVKMVVQLYYGEQWDVARIAEFLSLTKTTVKWRLHAGRRQIARELTKLAEPD